MSAAATKAVAAAPSAAASLPSPLQLLTVVKPVSMALMLGLFTLALFSATGEAKESTNGWQLPPAMDTFSSYEDMQRYFEHRNQRSLRNIENPLKDSYIEAFNHHNEQELHRSKRASGERKELPQPTLIRFEMSDAVEPSEEVKELIRQYKSRELQKNEKYLETVPPSNTKKQESFGKPIVKRAPVNHLRTIKTNNLPPKLKSLSYNKHSARPKRSTRPQQQPANFKVHYIPFQASDAREPDENTKMLIKRMRALEIEKLAKDMPNPYPGSAAALDATSIPTTTTKKPFMKRSKYNKQRKAKRSKRNAPEMIKFELSDAKDPDPSLKTFQKTKQTREAKDLKTDKTPVADQDQTSDLKPKDQNAQASKRYFVYKEAPAKVKKSVSALPHDVQNIISHLIKGNNGGKAYVKYIPAQQMDYNNLKLAYQAPKGNQVIYGHGGGGGGGYGKYGAGKGEQVQVPVVEKVQYVYHPVVVGGGGGHGGGYGGGGHGGGYAEGGGQEAAVKYVAAAGGKGGYGQGYAGEGGEAGYGVKYVAAAGGEGGHGGNYEAGAGAGHGIQYVAVGGGGHGGGYAGGEGAANHGGGYAAAGDHGGGYALVHGAGLGAHASYGGYAGGEGGHGAGGYAAAHGQAAAAIAHPIVVADAGGGKQAAYEGGGYAGGGYEGYEVGGGGGKQVAYEGGGYTGGGKQAAYEGGGYGEGGKQAGYEGGNEVIKNVAAPQFKGGEPEYETKYSVVPTVEQYAKTPTQEFKLKIYSPESLIAKAQLEAKDKAKAIEEQNKKAIAEAYGHAAGGGGKGGGGGHGGGYGGGIAKGYEGGGGGEGYGAGGHGGGGAHGGGGGGEGAGPVIKIEYHAPADSYKENYKEMPEFKQLSSLVGKSPEDQIHGLTYLLAKEMQNRLHLQRQHNYGGGGGHGVGGGGGYEAGGEEAGEGRPQDNKAPILFHPEEGGGGGGGGGHGAANHYQAIAQGKFIGMANSKQYIPVIEQAAVEEIKGAGGGGGKAGGGEGGGKNAAAHSYIAYGLSPNYKGISALKGGAPVAHQAGGSHYGNALHDAGYEAAAAKLQSYASKYAFGYRIRDFNTGNDFGHKQNRDLHGVTRGQYHILLPDGRIQNVIYHADDTGYHADVSFETGH